MSRLTKRAFEQPDPNDLTLAVDNLSDLWPSQAESDVDPTLAVSALQDLFPPRPARPVSIVDTYLPAAFEPALKADCLADADCLDDYFPDRDETPTRVHDDRAGLTAEDLCVETEIHRAAMEFQRFAEKFHVFASECERDSS